MIASARRIGALLLRYLLLVRRDPSPVVDMFYWPLVDIVMWGLLTYFVAQMGANLPNAIAVFLGAAILWNVFFRAAQDVSVSFLDDLWARSLVTLFASELTFAEFGVASTGVTLNGFSHVSVSMRLRNTEALAITLSCRSASAYRTPPAMSCVT